MTAILFLISLFLGSPAKADLGSADFEVNGPAQEAPTNGTFNGKCGKAQLECEVRFRDGKLIINNSEGIYRDQLIRVDQSRTCRQKSILLPFITSCFGEQLDYDFTIYYEDKGGNQRVALISFWPGYARRLNPEQKKFSDALARWRSDTTPYYERALEMEKKKRLSSLCSPRFQAFDCSWAAYVKANPQVKIWAERNPDLVEGEIRRLGLLP